MSLLFAIRRQFAHDAWAKGKLADSVRDLTDAEFMSDFGEGFDVKNTRRHADTLGLVSMEERAHLLGGTLTIRSSPGKGTVVRATCPLE